MIAAILWNILFTYDLLNGMSQRSGRFRAKAQIDKTSYSNFIHSSKNPHALSLGELFEEIVREKGENLKDLGDRPVIKLC